MIKITDLTNALVEKNKMTKKEAEFFISLFVDVITDGIKSDKQVKIKGLGTFKVTSVSSRESVDVNTGERIIIEGRDKISFTPETSLKNRVNAPFEQFETVMVNDDADFSAIDERYVAQQAQLSTEVVNHPEEKLQPKAPAFVTEEVHDNVDEKELQAPKEVKKKEDKPSHEEPSIQEDPTKNEEKTFEKTNDEQPLEQHQTESIVLLQADVKESKSVTSTIEDEKNTQTPVSEETMSDNNMALEQILHRTQRTQKYLLALVALLLASICFGGLYTIKQFSLRDNRIKHLMVQLQSNKQRTSSLLADSMPSEKTAPEISRQSTSVRENNATISSQKYATISSQKQQKDTKEEISKFSSYTDQQATEHQKQVSSSVDNNEDGDKSSNTYSSASHYNKDLRIRTGAYTITGIAKTVTVRQNQTLSSISKTYLGPGMECYIEAVNEKKTVKAGDKIRIPSLKLKKR